MADWIIGATLFATGRVFVRAGKQCKCAADWCCAAGTPYFVRWANAKRLENGGAARRP